MNAVSPLASAVVPDIRAARPTIEHEHGPGVSWAAIIAGAVGAAVLSLVLLLLGTGIGFSAISPWSDQGVSSTTLGVSSIVWMTIVQILASLVGGYLAGRLRTKWTSLHTHEAYFRDTAHGFLAWALATLITASLLSSAVGNVVSGGLKTGASVAGGAATIAGAGAAGVAGNAAANAASTSGAASNLAGGNPSGNDVMSYFTDSLFRPGAGSAAGSAGSSTPGMSPGAGAPNPTAEVGRIFATSLKNGNLSTEDSQYLAQLVAQRTGLSVEDAQKRVNDTFAQAQQAVQEAKTQAQSAADTARKAAAAMALWLVVSLLFGAFTASWAATFGGRLRDGLHSVS